MPKIEWELEDEKFCNGSNLSLDCPCRTIDDCSDYCVYFKKTLEDSDTTDFFRYSRLPECIKELGE